MPWATALDNVLLPLRLAGVPPAEAGPRDGAALGAGRALRLRERPIRASCRAA